MGYTIPFEALRLGDIAEVGGKNASLGELISELTPHGVAVPRGFALSVRAFREHLIKAGLSDHVYSALAALDVNDVTALAKLGAAIRAQIREAELPRDVQQELIRSYQELSRSYGESETDVAVRSSATAEDLPTASFAGQQESYLNVQGVESLVRAVRECMASLFTDRAIAYRAERGFDHRKVGLSVGVQKMVRSDMGSAGVIFTLDTESGSRDVVIVTSSWGLGESVVKGRVNPDEFWVHKPTFEQGFASIIRRDIGDKSVTLTYGAAGSTVEEVTDPALTSLPSLKDEDVLVLTRWALAIERHYSAKAGHALPMDIEWARDGRSGDLFIVQARPETVHAQRGARLERFGQEVTVCCAEGDDGRIYAGELAFEKYDVDPLALPIPRVPVMLNVANPESAFRLGLLPSAGVGLLRVEFVVGSQIGIHPMALVHPERVKDVAQLREILVRVGELPDPTTYFVERMALGVAQIAAAFYPRDVIVRFSDFKTNEYAGLLGGSTFEPHEDNPMIGFRGASRYYHEAYRAGFALECRAIDRVRNVLGLRNVKVMVPFCRTLEEARRVLAEMARNGLRRGDHDLEVYVMCEIPSNVVLADEFAQLFDGFSIGSNDLTQLTLGIDRDSATLAPLFDEQDPALLKSIEHVVRAAHRHGRKVGICGQAPSDHPDFAKFLADIGIDTISVTSDAFAAMCEVLSDHARVDDHSNAAE